MAISLNGTTGITTPDITSAGSLNIDASAPDNSLVVNSAGNVGIGTSSPAVKLDVVGAISSTTGANFATSSGNVMVGAGTAYAKLNARGVAMTSAVVIKDQLVAGLELGEASYYPQQASFWLGRYENVGNSARTCLTISLHHGNTPSSASGADTDVMTLQSSGNVGIGTSSPAYKLQVVGGAITASRARSNTAGDMGLMIAPSDSTIQYGFRVDSNTNNLNVDSFVSGSYVTRAIIDSSGNLLVGNAVQVWDERLLVSRTTNAVVGGFYSSSASYTSSVIRAQTETAAGTGWYFFEGRAAGGSFQYGIRGNGTVATSDVRRKKNIEPARSYLQDVCSIPIVKYNWKTDEDGAPKELGWLAQDVEKVFPNMVVTHHDGPNDDQEVLLLKKEVFLPMLMKCIQEQQATITLLTARIEALEGN